MRDLGRRSKLDEAVAAAGVAPKIDARRLDVTEFDAIPGFVESVVRDYGRIDVLVNNAGFAVAGFVEDLKLEEIRMQFETNFFGHVAMTQAVLPVMRRQRSGHIIMVSSIAGLHGTMTLSSYSASKLRSRAGRNRCGWKSTRWESKLCWSSRDHSRRTSGRVAR